MQHAPEQVTLLICNHKHSCVTSREGCKATEPKLRRCGGSRFML